MQRKKENKCSDKVMDQYDKLHRKISNIQYLKNTNSRRRRQIEINYRVKLAVSIVTIVLLFAVMMATMFKNPDKRSENINNSIFSESESLEAPSNSSSISAQELKEKSFAKWNESCDWSMKVINSANKIADNYTMAFGEYQSYKVDERIVPYLKDMIQKASNDGINLKIISAYRTQEKQRSLYNAQVALEKKNGVPAAQAEEVAAKTVARPGTSEHQTGLAIDFNNLTQRFTDTKEYAWLDAHAHEYGFIQRYSREKSDITSVINEPWHYRFVGKENAKLIKDSGLCLEEYVYKLEQGK